MSIEIISVPDEMIGPMFPLVGPHLMRALAEATDQTIEGVCDSIVDGTASLWAVKDETRVIGSFLTSLVDDGDGKTAVDVYALAGRELDKWGKQLSETMAAFAKRCGAHRILFSGRKGLLKFYADVRIVGEHSPGVYLFERVVA